MEFRTDFRALCGDPSIVVEAAIGFDMRSPCESRTWVLVVDTRDRWHGGCDIDGSNKNADPPSVGQLNGGQ
jgi:hypothetical protein